MDRATKETEAAEGIRRLLDEGEYVVEAGEPAGLVEHLSVEYSEKGRAVLPRHKRVVAIVLEDYDPVQTMEARRRGFDPDGVGG